METKPNVLQTTAVIGFVVLVVAGAVFTINDCCGSRRDRADVEREIRSEKHVERADLAEEKAEAHREQADQARAEFEQGEAVIEASEILILGKRREARAISDPDELVERFRAAGFKSARLRGR